MKLTQLLIPVFICNQILFSSALPATLNESIDIDSDNEQGETKSTEHGADENGKLWNSIVDSGDIAEVYVNIENDDSNDIHTDESTYQYKELGLTSADLQLLSHITRGTVVAEEDPLAGICQTPKCMQMIQQYMEWRMEHGEPGPSGRWGK